MFRVGPALVHSAVQFIKTLTIWQFPLSHQVSANQAKAMLRTTKHNTNECPLVHTQPYEMPSVCKRIRASIAQKHTQELLIHIHDAGYLSGIDWGGRKV